MAGIKIDIKTRGAIPDGVTDCSSIINAILIEGNYPYALNGRYIIHESMKFPSNSILYGKNAKIKLGDNCFDNLMRNADFTNGNYNIKIIGEGNFILDHNAVGNIDDLYTRYGKNGVNSYKYQTYAWSNVDDIEMVNINLCDCQHWQLYMQRVTNSEFHHYYQNFYRLTPNQDGIDFGHGCNNIHIHHWRGHSSDDFVCYGIAAHADGGVRDSHWLEGDIHDIEMDHIVIYSAVNGSSCALVVGEGRKLYNINHHDNRLISAGTILYSSYGDVWFNVPPAIDDVHDLTFTDITVDYNSRAALFMFGDNCKNVLGVGIINNTAKNMFESDAASQHNVVINGVDYSTP
jgi:hypothetical protein